MKRQKTNRSGALKLVRPNSKSDHHEIFKRVIEQMQNDKEFKLTDVAMTEIFKEFIKVEGTNKLVSQVGMEEEIENVFMSLGGGPVGKLGRLKEWYQQRYNDLPEDESPTDESDTDESTVGQYGTNGPSPDNNINENGNCGGIFFVPAHNGYPDDRRKFFFINYLENSWTRVLKRSLKDLVMAEGGKVINCEDDLKVMRNQDTYIINCGQFNDTVAEFIQVYKLDIYCPSLIVSAVINGEFDDNAKHVFIDNYSWHTGVEQKVIFSDLGSVKIPQIYNEGESGRTRFQKTFEARGMQTENYSYPEQLRGEPQEQKEIHKQPRDLENAYINFVNVETKPGLSNKSLKSVEIQTEEAISDFLVNELCRKTLTNKHSIEVSQEYSSVKSTKMANGRIMDAIQSEEKGCQTVWAGPGVRIKLLSYDVHLTGEAEIVDLIKNFAHILQPYSVDATSEGAADCTIIPHLHDIILRKIWILSKWAEQFEKDQSQTIDKISKQTWAVASNQEVLRNFSLNSASEVCKVMEKFVNKKTISQLRKILRTEFLDMLEEHNLSKPKTDKKQVQNNIKINYVIE